tara:strand:- start:801 stop:1223 length:423 start_codon:yes stop_codon:yes gene_type:complete
MKWLQKEIILPEFDRGYHIITDLVKNEMPELRDITIGMAQIFIKHTSASLTINEAADPTVRQDFESHMNKIVPENAPYYQHTLEGSDDMPAHLKSSLLGASIIIPISNGNLNLGTWQGIYLCEHRNYGGKRKIIVTINGQ